MTHTLRIMIVALTLSLASQTTFAQYATSTYGLKNTDMTTPLRAGQGQGLTNTGKGLMFTGASLAMTGITIGVVGKLTYVPDGTFDGRALYPIFTILGCAAGGTMALVGLPVYCTGNYKMNKRGASLISLSGESQRGMVGTVELGAGFANYINVDAIGGYNINNWLFVGAGMGYGTRLEFGDMPREKENRIAPVYGNLQVNFGSKCVTPYISTRIGYDLNQTKPYSAMEFGTRIRTANSTRGTSWWLGTKSEYLGDELYTIVFTAGKSF